MTPIRQLAEALSQIGPDDLGHVDPVALVYLMDLASQFLVVADREMMKRNPVEVREQRTEAA